MVLPALNGFSRYFWRIEGRLDKINIQWNDIACVCVVMASGLSLSYKSYEIKGIRQARWIQA